MKHIRSSRLVKVLLWGILGVLVCCSVCNFAYFMRSEVRMNNVMSQEELEYVAGDEVWSYFYYTNDQTTPIDEGGDYLRNENWKSALESAKSYTLGLVNFYYRILDESGQTVLQSNLPKGKELEDLVEDVRYSQMNYWDRGDPTESYYDTTYYSYNELSSDETMTYSEPEGINAVVYIMEYGVVPAGLMKEGDAFYDNEQNAKLVSEQNLPREDFLMSTVASAITFLLVFVLLCVTAGYVPDAEGVVCRGFHRIPFELYLIGLFVFSIPFVLILEQFSYNYWQLSEETSLNLIGMVGTVTALYWILTAETLVVRLKAHQFWNTCLITRVFRLIGRLLRPMVNVFRKLPSVPRLAIAGVGLFLVDLILGLLMLTTGWWGGGSFFLLLWIFSALLLVTALWAFGLNLLKIRRGVEHLAKGNLNARVEEPVQTAWLREFADDVNHVSDGMQQAVEERSKSSRFRAELIANVSHDLKTPLTSIINYVDLLKQQPIENETAKQYIEVLDRKSQRLKKLTEDLVEASKASTGSLTVHREVLNLTELAKQAIGEYNERFVEANLVVRQSAPDYPLYIEADGHHVWRVLDNLFSNCRKYAMPGTRIYFDVLDRGQQVEIWVRNISAEPLHLTAEELQERFVRGDSSRTTEGNGLGLSIARSLTELQHGTFRVIVDGDLFKVCLGFPRVAAPNPPANGAAAKP